MTSMVTKDEPFGHDDFLSKFERAWSASAPAQSISRTRTQRLDVHNGLLYSPMVYEYRPIDISIEPPSAGLIDASFLAFVRGEFGSATREASPTPAAILPDYADDARCRFDLITDYRDICEAQLLYSGAVRSIQEASDGDIVEDVLQVLTHPLLGHKANQRNIDPKALRLTLEEQVERKGRLLFVLPACPFKDQNPLRTLAGAAYPDVGEVAFLVSLHLLALALYQVHPFGADWVILSDGTLYADIFGITEVEAVDYRERLRTFRNRLNMQGTVSIIDLKAVLQNFTEAVGADTFGAVRDTITKRIHSYRGSVEPTGKAFQRLMQAMRWNLSTRQLTETQSPSAIWEILSADDSRTLDSTLLDDRSETDERAAQAAVEYATTNLLLRYCNVIEATFPGSLRATVHPKPGQLAVRALGSAYPWNGVGYRTTRQLSPLTFESWPAYTLAGRSPLRRVLLDGYSDTAPFYLEPA
jgi:pyoverdine/dityrosine biosynthesis protein Dit1